MSKFLGKIEDLQKLISDLGIDGEWMELHNHQYQFTSQDGAILNWWNTTKTVAFQGPSKVRDPFEKQVNQAVLDWKSSPKITRAVPYTSVPKVNGGKRVFVVHGHDKASRDQLELILHRLGLDPFVLANTGGGGLTLIEALEKEIGPQPGQCRFGIVLLTPDDSGYAKADGPEKAAPRARQNVVLEMGMVLASPHPNSGASLSKRNGTW